MAAFESIRQDLINSSNLKFEISQTEQSYLNLNKKIELENVTFTYPNKDKPTLKQLNMVIPVNSIIGLVGPSGSGKSTLIDIILGLIKPEQGLIKN